MKLVNITTILAVALLTACSAAPKRPDPIVMTAAPTQQAPQAPHSPSVTDTQVGNLQVPEWYLTPPEQTETAIYSAGYGTSRELNLALQKAMADADLKLSQKMSSEFQSLRKSYEQDSGQQVAKNFEVMTKTVTNNAIRGHHQKTAKVTMMGMEYRVFVLMTYPLGEANHFAQAALGEKLRAQAQANEARTNAELTGQVAPAATPAGGTVQLMDVNNEEYKAKRDAALQKPGAVIGQTTVR
jgi:hypothetical protein